MEVVLKRKRSPKKKKRRTTLQEVIYTESTPRVLDNADVLKCDEIANDLFSSSKKGNR